MLATPETSRDAELIEMIDTWTTSQYDFSAGTTGLAAVKRKRSLMTSSSNTVATTNAKVLAVLRHPQCDEPADQTRDHRQ